MGKCKPELLNGSYIIHRSYRSYRPYRSYRSYRSWIHPPLTIQIMQWEPIVRLVCKNLGFRWTAVAGSPVLSGLELSNEVSNIPHQSRCRPLTVTSGQKGWACNRGTTYTDRFSLSRGLINLLGAQSRFGDRPVKFQVVLPQNGMRS